MSLFAMKNILYPTDFSPASDNAFQYAVQLAAKLKAALKVLHVYQPPSVPAHHLPNTMEDFFASMRAERMERFKMEVARLEQLVSQMSEPPTIQYELLEGKEIERALLKVVKDSEADLLVMGTKGASGLKEVFVGSTTGELMENAPCPVLAVPDEAVFDGTFDKIAFATDYSEESKRALIHLVQFAGLFAAEVYCVNVDLSHTEFHTHKMEKFAASFDNPAQLQFKVLDGTDLLEALTQFLQTEKIDALAMVIHKRGFFQELFNYSKTKQMIYHSHFPVISIPAAMLG